MGSFLSCQAGREAGGHFPTPLVLVESHGFLLGVTPAQKLTRTGDEQRYEEKSQKLRNSWVLSGTDTGREKTVKGARKMPGPTRKGILMIAYFPMKFIFKGGALKASRFIIFLNRKVGQNHQVGAMEVKTQMKTEVSWHGFPI